MDRFDINYKDQQVKVQILDVVGQRIYKINLPAATSVSYQSEEFGRCLFLTSVPEGKQKLAEEIGALIEPLKSP
jgi:hypothetical protein